MKKYFEIIKTVNKDIIIEKFKVHEASRPTGKDDFAHQRINDLIKSDEIKYYKCKLKKEALSSLVLPHHDDDSFSVPSGGKIFYDVISDKNLFKEKANTNCIRKIIEIKNSLFPKTDTKAWQYSFLLLSNDKELVHPGHYHNNYGTDKIYIANGFHRLVAYGLALEGLNEFVSIEVYYGENERLTLPV